MELVLERKNQDPSSGDIAPGIMITPAIDHDYWEYRVMLTETQAVLGFPKFNTIGIGFAVEEDWNTNLPYQVTAEEIFAHIAHNKGDENIDDRDVYAAIQLIQEAAIADHGGVVQTRAERRAGV